MSVLRLRSARAVAWSPHLLTPSVLLGFWDAEAVGSLSLSGDAVITWTDLVGGYAPTQGTADARPTYSATSFNGRPGVAFDGTDDFLSLTGVPAAFPIGADPAEVWLLTSQLVPVSDTGLRVAFSYGGTVNANGRRFNRAVVNGMSRASYTSGNGNAANTATNSLVDYVGTRALRYVYTGTALRVDVDRIEGTETATTSATIDTRLRIGTSLGTPAAFWQGVHNAILVTKPLDATQAAFMWSYLDGRRGV